MPLRVGIVALLHESNTFVGRRTTIADFANDVLAEGEAVRDVFATAAHEVAGFFAGLRQENLEAVPLLAARALPSGTIETAAFDELLRRLRHSLDRAGTLDGILAAPHGATVSEQFPDADGHWLGLVRQHLAPQKPIVATIDPHANLSPAMIQATNAIVAYRTNPHVDQRQRGVEAAQLMARALRGEIQLAQAAAFPPLAINIERQRCAEPPCRDLLALAESQRSRPGVLSTSVVLGFPYADVPEMGSSTVAVTDGDRTLAQALADELADEMWRRRSDCAGHFTSVERALDQAAQGPGPVGLLDMGDNVGGGSPGDGTHLLGALWRRRLGPALACLCDPEAVGIATTAKVGGVIRLRVGGKVDDRHGEALDLDCEVVSFHDGSFEEPSVSHGGFTRFDQGHAVVVREVHGILTVLLTSRPVPPFSLRQLTSCGLDPGQFRYLVLKGVHAPVAAYAPVCKTFLRVDTPGSTSADLRRLTYRHRRRPLFPLESW